MNKLNKNPLHHFSAKASTGMLTLDIMDAIGEDFFGEGITAHAVKAAINQSEFSSITLNINSPGGDLFEGVAIYNALRATGKPVATNVIGLAASAASLIAMAGDTCVMNPGSVMMIHRAQAICAGYSDDMTKMADVLDTVTDSAADIYVAKTGLAKADVLALMADETWMTPEEAVKAKFATAVGKETTKVTNSFDLSSFKNTPIELVAKTKEVDGEDLTSEDFIWVGNPHDVSTWALPWHFSTEEKTKSHLRDALARFDQEEKIPSDQKAEAHAKLVRLAKEHGIEVSEPTATNAVEPFDDTDLRLKKVQIARRR